MILFNTIKALVSYHFRCGKDKIKELSENCKIEKNGFSSDMKLVSYCLFLS